MIVSKAKPDGTPAKVKRLSRRYINDIVGRVRQLFHWGVLHEFVPDDCVKALEIVPALAKGDAEPCEPLRPSVEGLLADPEPSDDLGNRRAGLGLPQRERNLLFCVLLSSHRKPTLSRDAKVKKSNNPDG